MEKYGYKKEKKDSKVKTAAEQEVCPICGKDTIGRPPICLIHGSEPFEEKCRKQKKK